MIDPQVIEEIKNKADIVNIVSKYLPLKKRGQNYLGLCPFHQEKTPSFTVSQDKGIFKCFGCGKSGNVFTFLREIEKLNFVESVKLAGEITGIEVKDDNNNQVQVDHNRILYDINQVAKDFFWKQKASPEAIAYLQKRNLSVESIQSFELGFAPDSWDALIRELKPKFPIEKLAEAGLVISKEDGSHYDRFRNRLMFPIKDIRGKVIGFSGRTIIEATDQAKYVNSPETPIFNKGSNLYGLDLAKTAIAQKDQVILVEGQMDVVACHAAGLTNTVASLGTAFTNNQARLLTRYTNKVIIAFDQDKAGQEAVEKTIDIFQPLGYEIKVLELAEKDPDEYLKKYGIVKLQEAVAQAKDFVLFKLDRILQSVDLRDRQQKNRAGAAAMKIITAIPNGTLKEHYITYLSQKLSLGREVLQELCRSSTITGLGRGEQFSKRYTPAPVSKYQKAEEALIGELLIDMAARQKVMGQLTADYFSSEWQGLVKYLNQSDKTYDLLLDEWEQSANSEEEKVECHELRQKITGLLLNHQQHAPIDSYVALLLERAREMQKNILREELAKAETEGNEPKARELMIELQKLR